MQERLTNLGFMEYYQFKTVNRKLQLGIAFRAYYI
jgi:hypothetical protein